jgi:hypothetical protein
MTITTYSEYEQLEDLLRQSPGTDCLESIVMDELIITLKDNGVKYPPFQPGQTCYYLYQNKVETVDGETYYEWSVESSIVKQISFNEFGTWVVLTDINVLDAATWGSDIFSSYAMAQLMCDKKNSRLNPDA